VAVLKDLTLGGEDGEGNVEVLNGVRAGDRLVVDAPPGLSSGTRVRIRSRTGTGPAEGGRP
jgi:hypothetical protein